MNEKVEQIIKALKNSRKSGYGYTCNDIELKEIEENENVINIEFNGISGDYIGYRWYSVYSEKNEIELYVK